jgi:site-specific DNA-methyltransferase (cytosine-N4-specific)
VYSRLQQADWTFSSAYTRGETHGIHSYPAKFIPQIPRELIAALHPGDGTAVMDPFCGSGTTLVEAALAGIPAVGVDLHPLACLISKVKVTPLSRSLVVAAEAALRHAHGADSVLPVIPALDHWFRHEIQRALAALVRGIESESDPDVRDALRVALSSIIVRVSNQESDTRYAAVEKKVAAEDVWEGFRAACQVIERALSDTWGGLFKPSRLKVINSDIFLVRPEDVGVPVSLVVTSPPYPNAYEYWLYHKYRMYWLGMDPIAVREREIGARPHFFKRNPHTPADFERQMGDVLALLAAVLVPGGHACFQVGSSVIHGQLIDNAELLRRAAQRNGFRLVVSTTRSIPARRKAFNPQHARIQEEDMLVFRLEE